MYIKEIYHFHHKQLVKNAKIICDMDGKLLDLNENGIAVICFCQSVHRSNCPYM